MILPLNGSKVYLQKQALNFKIILYLNRIRFIDSTNVDKEPIFKYFCIIVTLMVNSLIPHFDND